MQDFSVFVNNASKTIGYHGEGVRVAILDDGIDMTYAHEIGCVGKSFFVNKRPDGSEYYWPWYFSSTGHGTLMAALVRKICPDVKLFVARLDQTISDENGRFQPTADSAVEVYANLQVLDEGSELANLGDN
jgi:hypothetical protein